MQAGNGERGITTLFSDVVWQARTLLNKEAQLARAEMSDTAAKAGIALGLIAAGVVLLLPAFIILALAAVAGLEAFGFEPYLANLIVFAAITAVSIILVILGLSRLRTVSIFPRRAIRQLQQDVAEVKAHIRPRTR